MANTGMLVLLVLGISVVARVQGSFENVGVSYTVMLDVYSGNDDPEWTIDDKNPLYRQLSEAVNVGGPTSMFDGLGYRGFIVQAKNAFGQSAWKTVGRHTNRKLETLLLNSGPKTKVSMAATAHVRSCIYGQIPTPNTNTIISIKISTDKKRRKRQARNRVCGTSFRPHNWNIGSVRRRNNCYNYATNRRTDTFAQPGRGSGRKFTRREAGDVYRACIRDGLTPLSQPDAGRSCLIALVIWPGEDYHFYRLDANQYWSHKSGRTAARNTDDSGNRIIDPRMADTGPYTVFAGWLGVGPNVYIR